MAIQLRCVLCDEIYPASEEHVCKTAKRPPVAERREVARKAMEAIDPPSESKAVVPASDLLDKTPDQTKVERLRAGAPENETPMQRWRRLNPDVNRERNRAYQRAWRERRKL